MSFLCHIFFSPILSESCVGDSSKPPNQVIQQLPSLNQKVIYFMLSLIRELMKPEIVEATKMGKENLAVVFAPSFLRCPYQDYNKALTAADKEKGFLMT